MVDGEGVRTETLEYCPQAGPARRMMMHVGGVSKRFYGKAPYIIDGASVRCTLWDMNPVLGGLKRGTRRPGRMEAMSGAKLEIRC